MVVDPAAHSGILPVPRLRLFPDAFDAFQVDRDQAAPRRRRLAARETATGLRLTLIATAPDSLRDLLEQQQIIEERPVLTAVVARVKGRRERGTP
ncbi:MAG: hypothetical protein ACRDNW_21770 [Trebonia sp.]